MTAEVAVLNRFGVALAADSAVTVEHFHNNTLQTKVYNSANKLFTLSKFQPVGVMFYNAVSLSGIPWETVIKVYRKHLHRTTLDTIEEYANHFFTWLENNPLFAGSHAEDVVSTSLIRRFVALENGVKSKKQLIDRLEREIESLKKLEYVARFDDASSKDVCATYRTTIAVTAKVCFKKSHLGGQKAKISEYVRLLLTKKRLLPVNSGVVITGFGEKEALPQLREYAIDIIVCGRPRYWLRDTRQVNEHNLAEVVPLADDDVIRTLIEGVSPDFAHQAFEGTARLRGRASRDVLQLRPHPSDAQSHPGYGRRRDDSALGNG